MQEVTMGRFEARFADIIWQNEPISSSELRKIAQDALGWKKTTTFTVLKRLCDKGIFKNESGSVTSLISKDEFMQVQSEKFVEDTFDGSLPAFLAAFIKRKKLSEEEITQLRVLVAEYEGKK